jgi:hydrogenase maturation protease
MCAVAEQRTPAAAASTLVIGWGNELRGDDAAGRAVARSVAGWAHDGVTVLEAHQLLPEAAEAAAAADRVIFVDCRVAAPGAAAQCARIRRGDAAPAACGLGHVTEPAQILDLAWRLYQAAPEAWLVTVPGTEFDVGRPLSATTSRGMRDAEAAIRTMLSESSAGKEL